MLSPLPLAGKAAAPRAAGTKDLIYDVDFWISEKDGKMTVDQVKVHKDLGNSHVVP